MSWTRKKSLKHPLNGKLKKKPKPQVEMTPFFKNKSVDCSRAALVSVEMSWKQNQY